MNLPQLAPWVAGGLALAGAAAALLPPAPVRGIDVEAFSQLPALEGGRLKPLDSIARNSLLLIRGQQGFRHQGAPIGASEWLLDVLFRPEVADEQPVFVINDPDILGLLGLRQSAARYFSFKTLAPRLEEIERQAGAARQIDARQRSRFQGAIVNLFERIFLYDRLQNTLQSGADAEAGQRMIALAAFRPLPPFAGEGADAWRSAGQALAAKRSGVSDAGLDSWRQLGEAWQGQDRARFGAAAWELRGIASARAPDALRKAAAEALFNRAQPFYAGMIVYLAALLALFASWLWKRSVLQPAAFGLLVAAAAVHTAGLFVRIVLQGRPPVTNLYSSAVFVGWSAVVVGMVLERIYRRGFGTAVAAAAGFASLIVAHHLSGDGDTMEMMRAVLDSNFWLATHVVTITIGYSGTFLAGALAIGYALRRQFAAEPDPSTSKALASMVYGVVCFSLFFSFVGTVLGGIWADQSWGRFWGWDPKENGALLIVLWNAIILHARWGGYAREKGLMAMAIFGNVITSLSWFGVNMLGVGLHSYGFMEGAFWALAAFIASQLLLIGLCLLPPRFWKQRGPALASS